MVMSVLYVKLENYKNIKK